MADISLYESPSNSRRTSTSRNSIGSSLRRSPEHIPILFSECKAAGVKVIALVAMEFLVENGANLVGTVAPANRSKRGRTIVISQGRASPPRKRSKNLAARRYASCTTSSASCSLPVSQRARLYAESRCGNSTRSNHVSWPGLNNASFDRGVSLLGEESLPFLQVSRPRRSVGYSRNLLKIDFRNIGNS